MTQKPKFHRLRDQIDNSRKKYQDKIIFSNFYGFPSAMSHFHKSTKTRFPENPSKVVQLHNYIKSSEMVVRGWYLTHFDRRDILNSKKIGLGWFCDFSGVTVLILRIFTIFLEISSWTAGEGKNIFPTFDSEILFQKWFSPKILISGKTMIL